MYSGESDACDVSVRVVDFDKYHGNCLAKPVRMKTVILPASFTYTIYRFACRNTPTLNSNHIGYLSF